VSHHLHDVHRFCWIVELSASAPFQGAVVAVCRRNKLTAKAVRIAAVAVDSISVYAPKRLWRT
jgi:hypothetical protein